MYANWKPILSIYIDDDGFYSYEDGMTWGEWVVSSYNTGHWELGRSKEIYWINQSGLFNKTISIYNNTTGKYMYGDDIINPTHRYVALSKVGI